MVDEKKLRNHVTFVGHVANPASWLKQTDLVLVCSRNEAFGRVTIESFLLKKPVIGVNSGGTAELLSAAEGLLYELGDLDGLVQHIRTLVENESLREELSEKGNKWVTANISREIYVNSIMGAIYDMCGL